MVYAIEQDVADYHLIVANAQTFGVKNLTPIHGTAPAVFTGLPGAGRRLRRRHSAGGLTAAQSAFKAMRPGGRLVVNIASLEGLGAVYNALKELAPPVQGMLVNIARGTEQLETLRFEALNPTFLLTATKPVAKPEMSSEVLPRSSAFSGRSRSGSPVPRGRWSNRILLVLFAAVAVPVGVTMLYTFPADRIQFLSALHVPHRLEFMLGYPCTAPAAGRRAASRRSCTATSRRRSRITAVRSPSCR